MIQRTRKTNSTPLSISSSADKQSKDYCSDKCIGLDLLSMLSGKQDHQQSGLIMQKDNPEANIKISQKRNSKTFPQSPLLEDEQQAEQRIVALPQSNLNQPEKMSLESDNCEGSSSNSISERSSSDKQSYSYLATKPKDNMRGYQKSKNYNEESNYSPQGYKYINQPYSNELEEEVQEEEVQEEEVQEEEVQEEVQEEEVQEERSYFGLRKSKILIPQNCIARRKEDDSSQISSELEEDVNCYQKDLRQRHFTFNISFSNNQIIHQEKMVKQYCFFLFGQENSYKEVIRRINAKVDLLNKKIADQDKKIADQDKKIADQGQEIAILRTIKNQFRAEKEKLEMSNIEKELEIAKLKEETLGKELIDIQNSHKKVLNQSKAAQRSASKLKNLASTLLLSKNEKEEESNKIQAEIRQIELRIQQQAASSRKTIKARPQFLQKN